MSEKKIFVVCPICDKKNNVPVPIDIITAKESGATSVYIPAGVVCEHEFYAYVDKNFSVRDYLTIELSLMDEAKKAKAMKQKIINNSDKYNLNLDNIYKFISEKDFRSLIYACFLGSPIILIENNPEQERFQTIFSLLGKIYPPFIDDCNIFPSEKYLDYEKNNKENLEMYTIFNIMYKLSVRKPFNDSDSEPFAHVLNILKNENPKLRYVLAKNYIDYLQKWAVDYIKMKDEKSEKIIKNMVKKYPRQENLISTAIFSMLNQRNQVASRVKKIE